MISASCRSGVGRAASSTLGSSSASAVSSTSASSAANSASRPLQRDASATSCSIGAAGSRARSSPESCDASRSASSIGNGSACPSARSTASRSGPTTGTTIRPRLGASNSSRQCASFQSKEGGWSAKKADFGADVDRSPAARELPRHSARGGSGPMMSHHCSSSLVRSCSVRRTSRRKRWTRWRDGAPSRASSWSSAKAS